MRLHRDSDFPTHFYRISANAALRRLELIPAPSQNRVAPAILRCDPTDCDGPNDADGKKSVRWGDFGARPYWMFSESIILEKTGRSVAKSILGANRRMNLRTAINPRYLVRLGIVGLMCTGMCLYCIYDGTVTYPSQQKYYDEFEQFTEEHSDLDEKEQQDKWNENASSIHGWLAENLKKRRTEYDINGQFAMALVTGLIGSIFLYKLLSNRGRWIEADHEGLQSSEGHKIKFDQVTEFDKKLWQNKGIAKVLSDAQGKKQKVVLDDCNYDRHTTQAILRHVEANIDHSKITNGKSEPPPLQQEAQPLADAPNNADS